ncbi:hypothetical protein DUI87_02632 [Hirundo rustica rustica]|uniref:Choline/ethanolaminephosphotransferase 1 n=1 Tax=Hirundo rustica rustica TaxID=333673 RepID=A0A3M0L8X9_HIRRU|nr:hypothetical protein DUI87_02632 [Hirundo rustica rustica]
MACPVACPVVFRDGNPVYEQHEWKIFQQAKNTVKEHGLKSKTARAMLDWIHTADINPPAWIAPNLITIIELLINIFTTLLLVCYCPTATEQAPSWTFIACACGLFIYQSLNAIDGKQARRTKSSTPLGEPFDHGCDSLSTVFVVLRTCIAVQLGTNPDWMFFCCFAATFMFYWQTYVSGALRFGKIDVTEIQIFIIIMHLLAVIGGPPF